MAISFDVNAETRNDEGKGASRRLRRSGMVPGVIYGGGEEPTSIQMAKNEMFKHLEHEAFYSHILNVIVDGNPQKAVLRDVQRHPFKEIIMHMDFQRVHSNDVIKMQVPLHFINEETSKGVKAGGAVSHNLAEVNIMCKAKDLPEYIEVDLADVDVGQTVHLSDIKFPEGVESVELSHGEEYDQPVVTMHGKSAAAEEEEEGEAGEGGEA
ncbi:MAG: 50S ribosomal protein L25/general stress protein Ctc [Gammaproteobacteria bacterium]